ncbi:MAG: hypothetical protein OQJ97_15010 [Rhodospirillales bacterium]|nr:hypothetical protein [Rhodospirillales bacterium]
MLKKALALTVTGFILVSCGGMPKTSQAAETPNVLVLGVDGGQHMVRRGSPVFRTTREAVAEALYEQGFKIFDAAAVSMGKVRQHFSHRSDAEIIGIARAVSSPPIDIAVAFSAYQTEKKIRYAKKFNVRLVGRIIDIRTGRRLGNVTVRSNAFRHAGPNCGRGCIADLAAQEASILAPGLGSALAQKLMNASQVAYQVDYGSDDYPLENETPTPQATGLPGAYNLSFSGFKAEEMFRIEEYLVSFRGYKEHRAVRTAHRYASYWYETDIRTARLDRNLRKMLKRLGIKGRVALDGNSFTVQKMGARRMP